MEQSTHYHLNLPEGSDIVNPLTVDKPNYEAIDDIMYDNECAGVGTATELTTGTIHALTRAKNTQNVFKFTATSDYNVGDTFTVDGVVVTAKYSDGTTLSDKCYVVNSDVLCVLTGTLLTIFIAKKYDANNVMNGTKSIKENIDDIDTAIGTINSRLTGIKYTTFATVEAETNEHWDSIIGRLRDNVITDMASIINFCQLQANVDGANGLIFTCNRKYSSATITYWTAFRGTSNGFILYLMQTSGTSATLYKYAVTSTGTTVTNLSDSVGSNISVIGLDLNR